MTLSYVLGIALAVSIGLNILQLIQGHRTDRQNADLRRRLRRSRTAAMRELAKYAELEEFSVATTDQLQQLQQEATLFEQRLAAMQAERDNEIEIRQRYYKQQLNVEDRLRLTEANSHSVQQMLMMEIAKLLRRGAQQGVQLQLSKHIQGAMEEYMHESGRDASLGPWTSNVPLSQKELRELDSSEKLSQPVANPPDRA